MSDAGSGSKAKDETKAMNKQWSGKIATKTSEKLPQEKEEKRLRKDIISERYLDQDTKEKVELETLDECKDMEQTLYEHRWGKTSGEDISEIENKVDAILGKRPEAQKTVAEPAAEKRYSETAPAASEKQYAPAAPAWMDLPISGTIIDKRLLYKTAGGYIVEVVYRAPDGMLKTDRFSVTSVGDVEHTLDKLRQGAPVEAPPIQSTPVAAEVAEPQAEPKKEEKPKKSFAVPLFGKKKDEAKPAEPEPSSAPSEAAPATEEKKGRLLGKLPFGKKKVQKQ